MQRHPQPLGRTREPNAQGVRTFPTGLSGAAGEIAAARSLGSALTRRLAGPGGIYNLGNVIALMSGVTVQILSAQRGEGLGEAITNYLFGSSGASFLTLAIIIFMFSGEAYHRASAERGHVDRRLIRLGDLLSAIAALALTAALANFGDVLLALVAGTLLAGGKLGTAVLPRTAPLWLLSALRGAVVVSRLPSLASLAIDVARLASQGAPPTDAALPAITFFCFLLWLWADVLLMRGQREERVAGTGD